MNDLEEQLVKAKTSNLRMIATDGVFSMDGHIAKLDEITTLAKKYNAMVMVDDSQQYLIRKRETLTDLVRGEQLLPKDR